MTQCDLPPTMPTLDSDLHLDRVQQVEGYKVLPPCVLYGKIGQGGMGAVYRGRHLNLDIDVAVKCLKPDLTGEDEQFVVRFRREARSAARINHQNVVRVFDVSEEHGLHYIVMELVQGETARQRVQRKQQLGVGEALEILFCASNGLGEAHSKGFIHRDIKPDNIMIASSGQVKVADLGLAKPAGNGAMSMLSGTNVVMGTPQYMPPEQWENTATVTPAADVWALGATLYYLLVGGEAIAKDSLPRIMQRIVLQPFPDVREQRGDVPEDVAALIAKATAKDPGERFADAREMAAAIEQLQTRRQSLRDCEAISDGRHKTLVSPPPAKTLAKIKFWLDEQAQGGGSASEGPGGTVVVPPPETATAAGLGGNGARRRLAVPIGAVALVALVLGLWRPWSGGDPFADAIRLERQGSYAQAVQESLRVHSVDASLPGKNERLARLHAAWAQALVEQGRLQSALARIKESLGFADSERGRRVQRSALAQAAARIERDLQQIEPAEQPLERTDIVTFRGRLGSLLVRELRIQDQAVTIATDGSFAQDVRLAGAEQASVTATLTTGHEVALAGWQVRYREPDDLAPAVVARDESPAKKDQTGDNPSKKTTEAETSRDPEKPKRPRVIPVTVEPKVVELVGGEPAELTIRAPADAQILVDGRRVDREPGELTYVHVVRSDVESPSPLRVSVRRVGKPDDVRTIPVRRSQRALAFARAARLLGVRRASEGRLVTAEAQVKIGGVLSERAEQVRVNGKPVEVTWQDQGFSLLVDGLQVGENRLRVEATRRFCRSAEVELLVYRLAAPELAIAEETRASKQVAAAKLAVAVVADEWTERVEAGGVKLRRDRKSGVWRGDVPLQVGPNELEVVATNVVGQQSTRKLNVERLPASAKPQLRSVSVRVADEDQAVAASAQVFLRGSAQLVIESSDPAASVWINGEQVAASADEQIALQSFLRADRASRIRVQLQNSVGKSAELTFFAWQDATPPEAKCTSLAGPVAKGQPFDLRGTWADRGGLLLDGTRLGDLTVRVSPRGVARKGTWQVTHPGLEATTVLELVVVDRAGNRTVVPLRVEVQ